MIPFQSESAMIADFLTGRDLIPFIKAVGLVGLFGIVFAESGLLIGFFLPGDSLLFTVGFLASQGYADIRSIMILCFAAAVLGDSFGYAFGKKIGPRLFTRDDSLLFHKDNLLHAQKFYEKYGGKAVVLARFLPVIRTFAPIVAGVGKMQYRTFFFYNVFGGFLWAIGLTGLGFFLGNSIPGVDQYLLPIIFLIIVLSVLPTMVHLLRNAHWRREFFRVLRSVFRLRKSQ